MRRRDLFGFLAGFLAAWPGVAGAQVRSLPVVGLLHAQSEGPSFPSVAKFREGLSQEGFVEGRNVVIEYRWGNNAPATLPALAADLVQHRAAVIVTAGGLVAAKAAQTASATIPIVFVTGLDPAENGFVASLNRPGGNATGVVNYSRELAPKRLELMRELVGPTAKIAYLINADEINADDRQLSPGARKQAQDEKNWALTHTDLVLDIASGKCPHILDLSERAHCLEEEIATSFTVATERGMGALIVGSDPFLINRRNLLVKLAAQHALPTSYQQREYVDAGGLMSYGPNGPESLRQAGVYAGRILKGANPAEMPVLTPEKLELVINSKTARMLGLAIPVSLLVSADEIIK
jgi:putative ABC transport system substrate-binding protein